METSYATIPILHAFETALRDAFSESAETDVQNWCHNKTLDELVGQPLADEFYERWETETLPSDWRQDIQFYLGDQLNKSSEDPTILVRKKGAQFLLEKAATKGAGTWIDK